MKRKWWIALFGLLSLMVLFVAVFGKQIYISIIAKKIYADKTSFLSIVPEKRELSEQVIIEGYDLNAFDINLKIPFKQSPELSQTETEIIASSVDQFGFTVVLNKPRPDPFRRHLSQLVDSKIIQNYDQSLKDLKQNYKSYFDFVYASFVSTPNKELFFSAIQKSDIHLYQQATKYSHVIFDHTAEKIYYFVTGYCKVFQVGDPDLDGVVTLWIYPDNNKEIEINIITRKGNLKQKEIENIIASLRFL